VDAVWTRVMCVYVEAVQSSGGQKMLVEATRQGKKTKCKFKFLIFIFFLKV
jgi:hypothetical protein